MNIAYFYSFNNSFNSVEKNIHSKNYSFKQTKNYLFKKNIHSKRIQIIYSKKYYFVWKTLYRLGLAEISMSLHNECLLHSSWKRTGPSSWGPLVQHHSTQEISCSVNRELTENLCQHSGWNIGCSHFVGREGIWGRGCYLKTGGNRGAGKDCLLSCAHFSLFAKRFSRFSTKL